MGRVPNNSHIMEQLLLQSFRESLEYQERRQTVVFRPRWWILKYLIMGVGNK